jgi:hypothetical protein
MRTRGAGCFFFRPLTPQFTEHFGVIVGDATVERIEDKPNWTDTEILFLVPNATIVTEMAGSRRTTEYQEHYHQHSGIKRTNHGVLLALKLRVNYTRKSTLLN